MIKKRKNHRNMRGFTLIELMVVMVIISIVIGYGIYNYMSTIHRTKLKADVREITGALQVAKLRAISSGVPHGVAFWRDTTDSQRDKIFIFMDCAGQTDRVSDQRYTDDDDDPTNNDMIDDVTQCFDGSTGESYDPVIQQQKFVEMSVGIHFNHIFGVQGGNGEPTEYVVFNTLGQAVQGDGNLVTGRIEIQSRHKNSSNDLVDQISIEILGATGLINLEPMHYAELHTP